MNNVGSPFAFFPLSSSSSVDRQATASRALAFPSSIVLLSLRLLAGESKRELKTDLRPDGREPAVRARCIWP